MNALAVGAHFADPVGQSQQAFRAMLKASSRPGTVVRLPAPENPPPPLRGAVAAIALTLFDFDCPVWLDTAFASDDVRRYLHYHTGAPRTDRPHAAAFALIGAPQSMPPFSAFAAGDAVYPDRSATLVLQLSSLAGGPRVTLSGPGIEHSISISPCDLPGWFWPSWNENAARYPIGVDVFLADDHSVIGLPRTIKAKF